MSDCATPKMRFETPTPLTLEAAFDAGRVTSDGGLVWLSEMDSELGLCEGHLRVRTGVAKQNGTPPPPVPLVRQRVFQIACGYEDQNDSDALREDPLLKMACGSLPQSGGDLASQPTISRMENAGRQQKPRATEWPKSSSSPI